MSEEYNYISDYYKSFSGTDTLVFILMPGSNPVVLGSITTVSYSAYRTKQPVINLGRTNINGVTRGARIFAGTMIFTLINQHWLNELVENERLGWLANYQDLKSDELPLFDLMIVSANEYGSYVSMFIYGVDTTDEGQVISVEDLFTENTLSFVARDIQTFKAGSVSDNTKVNHTSDKKTINQVRLSNFYIDSEEEFEERLQNRDSEEYIKYLENKFIERQNQQQVILNEKQQLKTFYRELQYDPINLMVGDDVGYIQERLRKWNFFEWLSYIFDKDSEDATKKFQSSHGLNVTGVVDSKTYLALSKDPDGDSSISGIVINESGARVYAYPNLYSSIVDTLPYNTMLPLVDKITEKTFYDPTADETLYESGHNFYQIEQGYVNTNDIYSYEYSNKDIAFPTINMGESGPYVTLLQEMLSKIYNDIQYTEGIYDEQTSKLITTLQAENNIACVFGVVNEETWRVLQVLTGNLATDITNNHVTIKANNVQGKYQLTSFDVGTELFRGFDIEVLSDKNTSVKCCAIAYYTNEKTKILTKQFNIVKNELKTISFDNVQNLFTYSIGNGYPNKIEYIVYPYNSDSCKWIIEYRGE